MLIAGIEFPDECPDECPGNNEPFYQGNICCDCPIFNCHPVEYEGKMISLIRPDGFPVDIAQSWKNWFDHGMTGNPCRKL